MFQTVLDVGAVVLGIVCGVAAFLAALVAFGQRLRAGRIAKAEGSPAVVKRFRRLSWLSLVVALIMALAAIYLLHPAIVFDHIGL